MAGPGRVRLDADVDLTKTFAADQYSRGLRSWRWIGLGRKVPLFTSLFGDICFEAEDGYWWLDTVDGTLTKQWETAEELNAELDTPEGQERYLFGGLVLDAELRGLVPGPDQVLGFTVAPSIGGGFGVDNVEVIDFVTRLHMSGQLHDWLRATTPSFEA